MLTVTRNNYVSNGVTTRYAAPAYDSTISTIKVYASTEASGAVDLDNPKVVDVDYYMDVGDVVFYAALPINYKILIERDSNVDSRLVSYAQSSLGKATIHEKDSKQLLALIQEVKYHLIERILETLTTTEITELIESIPKGDTGAQGEQGIQGEQGERGEGVPEGGTVSQYLRGDLSWQTFLHALTSHSAGNNKLFYSNNVGSVTELPLGAPTQILVSNGETAAPTFENPPEVGTGLTNLDGGTADAEYGYVGLSPLDGGNASS